MFSFAGNYLSVATAGAVIVVAFLVSLCVYRVFFHELSRIPGPKLAAATKWYEFYYDVYLGGQFVFHIQDLHDKYGPIVRITPEEVHISDPDFYTEYFTKQGPQSKYAWSANRFGNETSTFSALTPEIHRMRRGALEGMFTRSQVRQLLPILQENVAKMLGKLSDHLKSGKVIRIDRAFFALSEDMIFEYGFGISHNSLDVPNFDGLLHEVFVSAGAAGALALQFPIVPKILNSLPDWVVLKLQPDFLPMVKMRQDFEHEFDALERPETVKSRKTRLHKTVMLDLLTNPDIPASMKTRKRMLDEGQLVIGAGLSTTGWAATVAFYHILTTPGVFEKMRSELTELIPAGQKQRDCKDLDWAALERLPYFQACIKEGLRLSYGMSARNTRLTPKVVVYEPSEYMLKPYANRQVKEWRIPPNTPISMSIPITSHNETIFPDSYTFNPERWLEPNKLSDRYFVTFGKGSRQCLGMQLAWAELSLMLAGAVRWFDYELVDTDIRAVKMGRDVTIPVPESRDGVKVKVMAEID